MGNIPAMPKMHRNRPSPISFNHFPVGAATSVFGADIASFPFVGRWDQ
jgi:hypothetical protein